MGKVIDMFVPLIISTVCVYLLHYWQLVNYENSADIIKQFSVIGTCAFGFLLTMFSLIIQGGNEAIDRMRKKGKPFSRFVSFNKKVVLISFITTLYAYFLGYLKFDTTSEYTGFLVELFYWLLIWFIIEVFYFLVIFYMLVQGEIKKTE